MKKEYWIIIILGVIILGLLLALAWPREQAQAPENGDNQPVNGLVVNTPSANAEISSPVKITGATNGDGWNGFEGQVGIVRLLDENGDQLGEAAILTAVTDWMSPPVSFEASLDFNSPKDQDGTLVFRNENPSGEPSRDKTYSLPVKIKKSSVETITVKAFFGNSNLDPQVSCNKVFPVERGVAKTQAVARAALEELLRGPTIQEKNGGYFTSINQGVEINSLSIDSGGTAKVDFNDQLGYQVGGSCKVAAIRAEITETLKQFPAVNNVIISINGNTEDILQP